VNVLRSTSQLAGWFKRNAPTWTEAVWKAWPHRIVIRDAKPGEAEPMATTFYVAGKWCRADTNEGRVALLTLRDGTELATSTGHSERRARRGRDYSNNLGYRLGIWGRGGELSVNRSLANAARMMTGEYPTHRIAVMRLVAESKEGDIRRGDETGCRFEQPKHKAGRKTMRRRPL
jgi:hypothetical protein